MKPITPNTKPELKKIRDTLDELTKSVNDIKEILIGTDVHKIGDMYPWHNTNVTGYDEEQ